VFDGVQEAAVHRKAVYRRNSDESAVTIRWRRAAAIHRRAIQTRSTGVGSSYSGTLISCRVGSIEACSSDDGRRWDETVLLIVDNRFHSSPSDPDHPDGNPLAVRTRGAVDVRSGRPWPTRKPSTDFARAGQRYDRILDTVGNRSVADLRRALVDGGKAAVVGFTSIERLMSTSLLGGKGVAMVSAHVTTKDLALLSELIEAGHVRPQIDPGEGAGGERPG
jgi:hypothetical protein